MVNYESIPDLFCQAFETKFTIRKHTLLDRLKTLSKIIFIAMSLYGAGDCYLSIAESAGDSEMYSAHLVDAQRNTKSETASALFQSLSSCADTIGWFMGESDRSYFSSKELRACDASILNLYILETRNL